MGKNPPANAGNTGLIPGPRRFHMSWLCESHYRASENSERDGNTRPPDLPLPQGMQAKQVKKQQLKPGMEQQTGSK